jgi:hypothetical protein
MLWSSHLTNFNVGYVAVSKSGRLQSMNFEFFHRHNNHTKFDENPPSYSVSVEIEQDWVVFGFIKFDLVKLS